MQILLESGLMHKGILWLTTGMKHSSPILGGTMIPMQDIHLGHLKQRGKNRGIKLLLHTNELYQKMMPKKNHPTMTGISNLSLNSQGLFSNTKLTVV